MSEPAPVREDAPHQLSADLTAVLAHLGGVLLSTETVDTAVRLVTRLAVETVPGTFGAGVTLVDERGKRTTAASDVGVEEADARQYQLNSGPCLTALREQVPVRIDDVAVDTRWPDWAAAVAELKLRSVLSLPLVAGGEAIGAIKVYSHRPSAYDAAAERLLGLFAQQAAILLANTQTVSSARQLNAQLTRALDNRDVIGQAKGILMARGAANDQVAFAMLVAASSRSNMKLHDVARQVAASVTSDNARRSPQV